MLFSYLQKRFRTFKRRFSSLLSMQDAVNHFSLSGILPTVGGWEGASSPAYFALCRLSDALESGHLDAIAHHWRNTKEYFDALPKEWESYFFSLSVLANLDNESFPSWYRRFQLAQIYGEWHRYSHALFQLTEGYKEYVAALDRRIVAPIFKHCQSVTLFEYYLSHPFPEVAHTHNTKLLANVNRFLKKLFIHRNALAHPALKSVLSFDDWLWGEVIEEYETFIIGDFGIKLTAKDYEKLAQPLLAKKRVTVTLKPTRKEEQGIDGEIGRFREKAHMLLRTLLALPHHSYRHYKKKRMVALYHDNTASLESDFREYVTHCPHKEELKRLVKHTALIEETMEKKKTDLVRLYLDEFWKYAFALEKELKAC